MEHLKKCDVCHAVVRAENQCPLCGNTLTYAPICGETRERYVWNRYFVLYMLKNVWFPALCCIFGAVRFVLVQPPLSAILLTSAALALLSLAIGVWQRRIAHTITWKYTATYAAVKTNLWKYQFGTLAVLFFCFV